MKKETNKMIPEKRNPTHPGEMLLEEFLKPMGMTPAQLAKSIKIPIQRIIEILKGKRKISAAVALKLSRHFGNSSQFWLNLQSEYDRSERVKTALARINKVHAKTFQALADN